MPKAMEPTVHVLQIAPIEAGAALASDASGFGPFEVASCAADEVWRHMAAAPVDVLIVPADWDGWSRCGGDLAVVVAAETPLASDCLGWWRLGAQDVVTAADRAGPAWPMRLRAAFERQRLRASMRQAFATDVHTGLPHVGQLIEHMSHLLALREREPAPMALLVLRIEGLATTTIRLGAESAGALRRKIAVRLRAGVRASDVVASVSDDSFAVLLSQIDAPTDAERVGRKLLGALGETFKVAGHDVAVATALGIAVSPADGSQPAVLLRRAEGLAASAQAVGRDGYANLAERGGPAGAANDDEL